MTARPRASPGAGRSHGAWPRRRMPCLCLNKTSRSDSPGSRSQGGPRKRPLKLSVMTGRALRAWCGLKFLLTERKDVLLERESVCLQTWSLGCSSFRWFFVPESPVLLPRGSQRWHFGEWVRQPSRGPLMRPPTPRPHCSESALGGQGAEGVAGLRIRD